MLGIEERKTTGLVTLWFLLNGLQTSANAGCLSRQLLLLDPELLRSLVVNFNLAESGFGLFLFAHLLLKLTHFDQLTFLLLFFFNLFEDLLLFLLGFELGLHRVTRVAEHGSGERRRSEWRRAWFLIH